MKKILLLLAITILSAHNMYGQDAKDAKNKQAATDTLPYQKFPTLPAFNILLQDSVTIFNTYNIPADTPVVIMFFDPDCRHCQALTKRLTSGMDSLKNIRFYMVTSVHNMTAIRNFYKEYHLGDYKNIMVVGQDYEFFFVGFYGIKFVPDLALYDGHKKLVKFFESHTTVKELYEYTH